MADYVIRECSAPACRARYPAPAADKSGERCPWCGSQTTVVHTLATPAESRALPDSPAPVAALLDNVRSLFNVGSIFRSADGAGMEHLYLCGFTPTPANRKLAKTALGAEETVAWSHHRNAVELARSLVAAGAHLWALETAEDATPLFAPGQPPVPLVLVVGNEVTGIDPDLLSLCEQSVAIPMSGHKRSLNVATAFGIAAVVLRQRLAPMLLNLAH